MGRIAQVELGVKLGTQRNIPSCPAISSLAETGRIRNAASEGGIMLSVLVTLLILLLIFALIWWVITLIPLPPPMLQWVRVVIAIIFVIVLIYFLLPLAGAGGHPLLR
jgi:hypothetical protein